MSYIQTRQKLNFERQLAAVDVSIKHYAIRDPNEANDLACAISRNFPEHKMLRLGLVELLLNAIEHGNLEIGFDLKTKLLNSDTYIATIRKRLSDPAFRHRHVDLYIDLCPETLTFTIFDQGRGFNPTPYKKWDMDRAALPHGRGIALACQSCFDKVNYNKIGNTVKCTYQTAVA